MKRCAAMFGVTSALLLAASSAAQESGSFKVIVNPANPATSVSKAQLTSMFLRRTGTWDNGQPVQPVDQTEASPLRQAFSREVLGMAPAAAAQRMAASPTGDPPLSVATDREVLAYVRLKPGAIGYVSASTPVPGVKVVPIGRGGESAGSSSQEPLAVGGAIQAPARISEVRPKYPPIARAARIQGTVELQVVVGPNGAVESARVTQSIPALDEAAIEAVRQWKYAPTLVNGTAVPVTLPVKVTFVL
jgi:TonB family protein